MRTGISTKTPANNLSRASLLGFPTHKLFTSKNKSNKIQIIKSRNSLIAAQLTTSAGEAREDEPERKERGAEPTADKGAQK